MATSANEIIQKPDRSFATRRLRFFTLPFTMISIFLSIILIILSTSMIHENFAPRTYFLDMHAKKPSTGAVSCSDLQCSNVGLKILKGGGNAADAAIATEFCLGIKLPDLVGLGGGGFALVRDHNGEFHSIDFRETAPSASSKDMYKGRENASLYGGLAIAVPGELRGLEYIHRRFASLPWDSLIRPAIEIAKSGFLLNQDLSHSFDSLDTSKFLTEEPWARDFAPNGTLISLGGIIKRERLATTLEQIAKNGADHFYKGTLATDMIAEIRKRGGIMSAQDLETYEPVVRKSFEIKYRGYRIVGPGAPAGAPVVLSALNILKGYSEVGSDRWINLTTHRIDEALRFAYAQRAELGDPEFIPDVLSYQSTILHEKTGSRIRNLISDERTLPPEVYNPNKYEILPTPGTSHLVTADKSGLIISLTSTLNTAFGSRVMDPGSGIILNNEMNDFSIPNTPDVSDIQPSPKNFIAPGKRPQSSMSPIIVEMVKSRRPYLSIGGEGGSHIISAVAQVLWYVLDRGMDPLTALYEPRFHDQLQPNEMSFEITYDNGTVANMTSKGHNTTWSELRYSRVHVFRQLSDESFEAAAEPALQNSGGLVI